MSRARVPETLLAGAASAVVAWPLVTLFTPATWVRPTLAMIAVVVVAGLVGRRVSTSWPVVGLVQLVAVVLAAGWIHGRGHLWYGLPTLDTVLAFNNLLVDARETIQNYAAPAPTNRGVILAIGLLLGVTAVVVDHLAVMRRSPAMAGLPLLAAFLISASNSGEALHPMYFVVAGAVWLMMLGRQGISSLRRWGTTVPMSIAGRRTTDDREGAYGYAALGRTLAAAGLAAAVAVPVVVPHLPTRYLIDGLGRSTDSTGFSDGQIGLKSTVDLQRSLGSRSQAPVLTYTTNARTVTPLRVGVLENYANDQWRPESSDVRFSRRPDLRLPDELGSDVPREQYRISVDESRIEAPQIAAPTPLVSADLDGVAWGLDENLVASVNRSARSYSFTYLALNPSAETLAQPVGGATGGYREQDLQVDPASQGLVAEVLEDVVPDGANRIETARAIQKYLRSDGGFRYSLQLPDTVKNAQGQDERPDAVSLFLRSKIGYCTQFATAMVMMARQSGIPARLAIGFLPGTAEQGTYTVKAADAHAWPELFFEGVGWLRFEPTPSGTQNTIAPSYSLASTTPGGPDETSTETATGSASTTSSRPDGRNDPGSLDPGSTTDSGRGIASILGDRSVTILLWLLVGLVVGILGALAVPLAARSRLRRRLRHATDDAQRVEIEWRAMVEHIGDLGVIPPRGSTPRQAGRFFQREAYLEGDQTEALHRVVDGVERSRYARPGTTITDIRADTEHVVRAVSAVRRRKDRLRAAWWPTEGVNEWRDARASVTRVLRSPLDRYAGWRTSRRG
jgi:transglutaminase-like putative cysteine protease